MRNRFILAITFSAMGLVGSKGIAQADDRYYMMMFASQAEPNLPRLAHTFALFVKAPEGSNGKQLDKLETHSISWMPNDLNIQVLRAGPVMGKNLTLDESLKLARSMNARVTMWGPFLVKKELFDMASRQEKRLNNREIEYIVLDRRFRGRSASNCIHAVADLDTTQPALITGTAHGEAASEIVLRHLEKYIISSKESPRWLLEKLNLKPDEIRFATLEVINESK
jgi:hypothetical protein